MNGSVHNTNSRQRVLVLIAVCTLGASTALAQTTVGPSGASECGGGGCDYDTISDALNAAGPGDTIIVYRLTDSPGTNQCYDEHLVINGALDGLTIQGASTTPASAACIAPSDEGTILEVNADNVTIRDLEISGRANDGAAGLNTAGTGGRGAPPGGDQGAGIFVTSDGVDIRNCTVAYTYADNIKWKGASTAGITIQGCYIHHSDHKRNIRIVGGDGHVIRNNLIHKGQGILVNDNASSNIQNLTIEKNIVQGWSYWGHFTAFYGGTWPETGAGGFGGGWRYYSDCICGIWVSANPSSLSIQNNLVVATWRGIRVKTTGTIRNNTIVNPWHTGMYDYDGPVLDASVIRDNTFGIMLQSGFAGTVENNLVVVTDDQRANGNPGQASAPRYSPGITGYGIAFENNSGSSAGATIRNNNVFGFVDTNGYGNLNYGVDAASPNGKMDQNDSTNISVDPGFATDNSDETNGGSGPCDADADNTRCYELYWDNYFLASSRGGTGSCHADIWDNTAGFVGFVDLSNGGANNPSSDDLSGVDDCARADDSQISAAIDVGNTAAGMGNEVYGGSPDYDLNVPNLGAFGRTDRASWSADELVILGIDVGNGGVKGGDDNYSGPGIVQARSAGITEVNMRFNRPVTYTEGSNNADSSFQIFDYCNSGAATRPSSITGGSTVPYTVTLTWPSSTFGNEGIYITALGTGGSYEIADTVAGFGEFLDGEISDPDSGTMPSGNGTAGGDADFRVYSLIGDVDGDLDVDSNDRADTTAVDGSTEAHLPEDVDGDGTVEGAATEDDYVAIDTRKAELWVNSSGDTGAATDLRYALTNVADNETIKFAIDTFASCANTTIDVDTSALPTLDNDGVTLDASEVTVIVEDTDSDLAGGAHGLTISGDSNTITGLTIRNFDAGAGTYGILIDAGASNNTIGTTTSGEANTITGSGGEGISIQNAASDQNTIRGNLIHSNGDIPIDIVTAGAQDDVTAPTISGAYDLQVSGTSSGSATIDLCTNNDNDQDCEVYVGSTTASAGGSWTLSGLNLTAGEYVVAFETDTNGNTSEASSNAIIVAADYIVDTTVDENDGECATDCSLRDALALLANGEIIVFDATTFPPSSPATIDVDTSQLPAISANNTTIDASNAGVIIEDTDSDLADGDHGLEISGSGNTIKGLRIKHFDAGTGTYGVLVSGDNNTIGGAYDAGAANGLGTGCQISSNYHGIGIDAGGAGTSGNTVQGCLVGTDINGTGDEGNTGYGIYLNKADSAVIGTTTSGEENLIAYNGDATYPNGIYLTDANSDFDTWRGNLIWDNNGIAIDIIGTANNSLAAPVITSIPSSLDQIDGTSANNATVDVYTNTDGDSDCLVYEGTTTADGAGNWSLTGLTLTDGEYAVAIQTNTNGDSSEVSTAVIIDDGSFEVSGIAYANDGSTPLTGTARTVALRINGGAINTDSTDTGDGSWSITGLTANPGDTITIYFDGEAETGNIVTVTNGAGSLSGLALVDDRLTVRADNGAAALTIDDMVDFDNDNDSADLLFTATSSTPDTLSVENGVELYIDAGITFQPGGDVDVGTGGIQIVGTWDADANNIKNEGDWDLDGTFTADTSEVIIDGSGTTEFFGSSTFYDLTCLTAAKTLQFPASTTTTISNILTLEGTSGNEIVLQSSGIGEGNEFDIDVEAVEDAGGNPYVEYVDVTDSDATGTAADIQVQNSINNGNTTGWDWNAYAVYCYDTRGAGWTTDPDNMIDCNTGTEAQTQTDADLEELTAHTLESGGEGSGAISAVELRVYAAYSNGPGNGSSNTVELMPVFDGTDDGSVYDSGALGTAGAWSAYLDITADGAGPGGGSWTWTDVTNLDVDVLSNRSGGNVHVYKIELRVTYECCVP